MMVTPAQHPRWTTPVLMVPNQDAAVKEHRLEGVHQVLSPLDATYKEKSRGKRLLVGSKVARPRKKNLRHLNRHRCLEDSLKERLPRPSESELSVGGSTSGSRRSHQSIKSSKESFVGSITSVLAGAGHADVGA